MCECKYVCAWLHVWVHAVARLFCFACVMSDASNFVNLRVAIAMLQLPVTAQHTRTNAEKYVNAGTHAFSKTTHQCYHSFSCKCKSFDLIKAEKAHGC